MSADSEVRTPHKRLVGNSEVKPRTVGPDLTNVSFLLHGKVVDNGFRSYLLHLTKQMKALVETGLINTDVELSIPYDVPASYHLPRDVSYCLAICYRSVDVCVEVVSQKSQKAECQINNGTVRYYVKAKRDKAATYIPIDTVEIVDKHKAEAAPALYKNEKASKNLQDASEQAISKAASSRIGSRVENYNDEQMSQIADQYLAAIKESIGKSFLDKTSLDKTFQGEPSRRLVDLLEQFARGYPIKESERVVLIGSGIKNLGSAAPMVGEIEKRTIILDDNKAPQTYRLSLPVDARVTIKKLHLGGQDGFNDLFNKAKDMASEGFESLKKIFPLGEKTGVETSLTKEKMVDFARGVIKSPEKFRTNAKAFMDRLPLDDASKQKTYAAIDEFSEQLSERKPRSDDSLHKNVRVWSNDNGQEMLSIDSQMLSNRKP